MNIKHFFCSICVYLAIFRTVGLQAVDLLVDGKLTVDQDTANIAVQIDQSEDSTALHVEGGSGGNPLARFIRDNGGSTPFAEVKINAPAQYPQVVFTDYTSVGTWSIGLDAVDNSFQIAQDDLLYASPDIYLTVDDGGNVGIGTESPGALLHTNKDSAGIHLKLERTGASPSNYAIKLEGNKIYHASTVDHVFQFGGTNRVMINASGFVGIGTMSPTHELSVNGTIQAKEVVVESGWSDFVFDDDYELRDLASLEAFIEKNGHLPDVPPASVVESDGLSIGESQRIMMQKIEELTLYVIELKKQNDALRREIEDLK